MENYFIIIANKGVMNKRKDITCQYYIIFAITVGISTIIIQNNNTNIFAIEGKKKNTLIKICGN